MRESFRRYVDSRLEAYRRMPDLAAVKVSLDRSTALQNDIWAQAVKATQDAKHQSATLLILPAIGKMISISGQRTAALYTHPLKIIFFMLAGLC